MNRWKLNRLVAALAIFGVVAACDSPVDPEDHPEGAVFLDANGAEVARFVYQEGVTGQLQVGVGETATYRVRVLTESGELLDFDGSEYSIVLPAVNIATIATVALQGADRLALTGLATGGTSIRFQLHHGGHEEFLVSGVPLVVP